MKQGKFTDVLYAIPSLIGTMIQVGLGVTKTQIRAIKYKFFAVKSAKMNTPQTTHPNKWRSTGKGFVSVPEFEKQMLKIYSKLQ